MTANGSGLAMSMVVAIIRHERLQEVQDVLDECGVSGVTVTEVKGCGAQRGYTEKYRGASVHISLRPRLKVEAVMKSEIVTTVVDKLAVAGRTGDGASSAKASYSATMRGQSVSAAVAARAWQAAIAACSV